jgi:hypothetical protein
LECTLGRHCEGLIDTVLEFIFQHFESRVLPETNVNDCDDLSPGWLLTLEVFDSFTLEWNLNRHTKDSIRTIERE